MGGKGEHPWYHPQMRGARWCERGATKRKSNGAGRKKQQASPFPPTTLADFRHHGHNWIAFSWQRIRTILDNDRVVFTIATVSVARWKHSHLGERLPPCLREISRALHHGIEIDFAMLAQVRTERRTRPRFSEPALPLAGEFGW